MNPDLAGSRCRLLDTAEGDEQPIAMQVFAPACLSLVLAGAAMAADQAPLVKVGNYHLKTSRYGAAVVADGDFIYVVGGGNQGGLLGDIQRFNIVTHEENELTHKLIGRHYHGAALINGKIYIVGGLSDNAFGGFELSGGKPEPEVEIFDLGSGAISRGAPMPTPRSYAATASRNGKIYVLGGTQIHNSNQVQTSVTEIYDVAANAWSPGARMPTPREARAAVVDDFIIVPGGLAGKAGRAMVEFYLIQRNEWRALPDLCENVNACSVAFLGNYLFLFGNNDALSHVIAYDLRNRTSRVIKIDFKPVRHSAAVAHRGQIFVVGGNTVGASDGCDDIQVFALADQK